MKVVLLCLRFSGPMGDLFQIKMISSSSSSDEEWRKKGVEFKIIDEGERENKSKESKQETVSIGWIF